MRHSSIFTALIGAASMCAAVCCAEEAQQDDRAEMGREGWHAHIKATREQADEMRRQHRSSIPLQPTVEELAEAASKRILEDDSLQPGDIVSTNHGIFRFRGSPDRERKPEDFVRIR